MDIGLLAFAAMQHAAVKNTRAKRLLNREVVPPTCRHNGPGALCTLGRPRDHEVSGRLHRPFDNIRVEPVLRPVALLEQCAQLL
jgi:hypothetical protein